MTVETSADMGRLKESCLLAALVRDEVRGLLRPGVKTRDLDAYAEERIGRLGGSPAFKGYRGYPATVCVSIDDEIVHGIPGERKLKEGELVSLDLGVVYGGFYSDTAFCEPVGKADEEGLRLIRVTREAFMAGLAQAKAGNHVSDISHAIQLHVEKAGFSVVREFVGHGIGKRMHEEPQIPNFGEPGRGEVLVRGRVLAIEPMVNAGSPAVRVKADGWTAVTVDGKRSAHHEHTVLVTDGAPEVLTAGREC